MPFRLGILSDTHGLSVMARRAFDLFVDRQIDYFIHCGDIGDFSYDGVKVLETLLPLNGAFVFGNNDYDKDRLRDFASLCNIDCLEFSGVVQRAGKKIGVTHGDSQRLIQAFTVLEPKVDYLLTGHTHQRHDQTFNNLRWINPGALHRTRRPTVAVLELESGALEFFDVGP